ncbi:MAG: hypothetical protein JNL17_13375 [Cyclobacteriaceae bacterium]|nr:hypothetical protein [Cyclobacteriaceae bacterium]
MSLRQIALISLTSGAFLFSVSAVWMAATQPLTTWEWIAAVALLISSSLQIMVGIKTRVRAKKEGRVGSLHFDFREGKTL